MTRMLYTACIMNNRLLVIFVLLASLLVSCSKHSPMSAQDQRHAEEERRHIEDHRRQVEDARRKAEDEQRRVEDERRRVEDERRRAEDALWRAEDESNRLARVSSSNAMPQQAPTP
jgi:septal ring factor EnvC (AmiA/AmiB activator)